MLLNPTAEYQTLYETASDILFDQDLEGRIIRVNRAFERATGLVRQQILGSLISEHLLPEQRSSYHDRILASVGGAASFPFEIEILGAAGPVYLELKLDLVFDRGKPTGIRGVGRDISEKVRSRMDRSAVDQTLLRQTEQLATFSRYVQLLHRLSTTNYGYLEDLYSDYLATGCEIFSLENGAIVEFHEGGFVTQQSAGEFSQALLDDLVTRIRLEQATAAGPLPGHPELETSFFVGTPIRINDELFGALLFWCEQTREAHPQAREMIEMMERGMESAIRHRRLTEELERRARYDALTGLPNRAAIVEMLQQAIDNAAVQGTSVGVIFIDLDRFKQINDTNGHAAGDEALQQIARRFEAVAGSRMTVGRLGGDEFAVVLPDVRSRDEAMRAGTELTRALDTPLELGGEKRHVGASFGVALFPDDESIASALLVKADAAMYRSKHSAGSSGDKSVSARAGHRG